MAKFIFNLQLFGDGGAGAGAAPAGGTGDGGEAAVTTPGTLEDGTVVDNRLAARMEEQAKKRRNRGESAVYANATPAQAAAPQANKEQQVQPQDAKEAEKSLDDEWIEAKKGKFKDQFGRDVKAAVDERFKNQKDANDQLAAMKPMLDALMKKAGVESIEELQETILNDDSLYEEEAEKAGMTVEGYRNYQQMLQENERLKQQEQQEQQEQFLRAHIANLARQAEEMKKTFPNFDLKAEMENETFRRMVAPNSGLKVEDAYYAIHHNELEPQAMAYGIQRAQQQISQTLQANRARPVEGAIKGGQPANVAIDPSKMTRAERQKLLERARRGEKIVF